MTRLVLLPGLDGTGELFAGFIAALEGQTTQVIAYPPDRELDYAGHEAYVRARLPQDEDFVLLGESFSGPVSIALAATRPRRLKGLILCASFAANPLPGLGFMKPVLAVLPAARPPAVLTAPWLYGGRATPALRRAHAAAMARVSAGVLKARAAAVLAVDYRAQLRKVDVPMLYLRARGDRLIPRAAARTIIELRPDTELVEIDGPHFLLQTEPDACAAVVLRFLRERIAATHRGE